MASVQSRFIPDTAYVPGTERRALDGQGALLMLSFCIVLGLQQVAIKAIATDIAPLAQIALRSILAALLVMGIARWRGVRLTDVRAVFGPGVLVGLGFASEFTFVALGLGYTTASHMAVFLYTAPVFAALGLHYLVPGEQLEMRHWIGIAIAFAGVLIAMAPGAGGGEPNTTALLIGDGLGMLAVMSWAASTLVIRTTRLAEARPVLTLSYQLATAGLLLMPAAALLGDFSAMRPTGLVVFSMLFQTVVVSFGALLLWFALLRRYLASRLGVFSLLSPVFGVIFGVLLLGDPLTVNFILGGIAISLGVLLVTAPAQRQPEHRA